MPIPRLRSLASAVLFLVFPACGGDDAAKGTATGAGIPTTATPAPASPTVAGKPRIPEARLIELTGTEVTGLRRSVVSKGKTAVAMKYDGTTPNAKGAYPSAYVILEHCQMCEPMDVAAWKKIEWIRAGIPKPVQADPGLVFDVHEVALPGGKRGIGVYKEGIGAASAEPGAYTPVVHGYQLLFNDGGNQIQIDVSSMGAFPKTREELRATISRDDLAAAAKRIYEAFASEF